MIKYENIVTEKQKSAKMVGFFIKFRSFCFVDLGRLSSLKSSEFKIW
jgi:hypothetical protein